MIPLIFTLGAIGIAGYLAYTYFYNRQPEEEEEEEIMSGIADDKVYIDVNYPGYSRPFTSFKYPYTPPYTGPFYPYTRKPQGILLPPYTNVIDVPQVPVYPF